MFNIAVIGTGQIGSRHIQGLCKLKLPFMLHMVDTQPESLALARERINELPGNENIDNIHAYQQLEGLPDKLDLVIVATSSSNRLQVLEELLSLSEVRNLVLEKFLFQSESEFEKAASLLSQKKINTWVNCPRRQYEIYNEVREFFHGHPIYFLEVNGGDWGLGCNSVHFADLYNYITGSFVDEYETGGLDTKIYPSKRQGYVEFKGRLLGFDGSKRVQMTSMHTLKSQLLLLIRGESRSCIIDESSGLAWFFDETEGWSSRQFRVPYQSELSEGLALSILEKNNCPLPKYNIAAEVHLPLLRSFLRHHIETTGVQATSCPIT